MIIITIIAIIIVITIFVVVVCGGSVVDAVSSLVSGMLSKYGDKMQQKQKLSTPGTTSKSPCRLSCRAVKLLLLCRALITSTIQNLLKHVCSALNNNKLSMLIESHKNT